MNGIYCWGCYCFSEFNSINIAYASRTLQGKGSPLTHCRAASADIRGLSLPCCLLPAPSRPMCGPAFQPAVQGDFEEVGDFEESGI